MPPVLFQLPHISLSIFVSYLSMQKIVIFKDAFTYHSILEPVLSFSMLFEVIIDATNINIRILIDDLNWTHGLIAVPNPINPAFLS